MVQQQTTALERLRQLIGEWQVGIALRTAEGIAVAGCGEMSAVEVESGINSEINTHIEGYEDYYENDLWTVDDVTGQVHLYSVTSDGEAHDHVGKWRDDLTLELNWRGTYEDQDREENVIARWANKDQIELKVTNYRQDKPLMTTDYVFKRKNLA
ncbi:MAG: hypothetical protein NWE93_11570 [Candidatus Bathyarchaeota archaeon]|nr:hypothetical protein [Candidatus Bathyarchaeota archaeon]